MQSRLFVPALLTVCLGLFGSSSLIQAGENPPGPAKKVASLDQDLVRKWSRSCALCHVGGEGGAPRIGTTDWLPRIAKGKSLLLAHTIEGLNNMPPLGYCMSCEEADFSALIKFMSGESP